MMTAAVLAPLNDHPATELRYEGTLTTWNRKDDGTPVKRFSVDAVFIPARTGGKLVFLVDEDGGGGWAWPERFGVIDLDRGYNPTGKDRIQLLHTHDGTQYPIPVRQPLFEYADKLQNGADWKVGKRTYEVQRKQKIDQRECWRIASSGRIGHVETIWVDAARPLVIKLEQTVFMGRGDRFRLKLELLSEKTADLKRLAQLAPPIDKLSALKKSLKRKANTTKPELDRAQLDATSRALKEIGGIAESTPFEQYVATIRSDLVAQLKRDGSVAGIAGKFLGKAAPRFQLKSLAGKAIDAKEHAGKIIVLHFWEYQGKPLVEPYGQVGYLDFLNGKRRKLGVKVYGVAVDPRLAQTRTTPAALRSIRKLKDFMNLEYPITVDDGALLRKFGDPRTVGAKLPLWVVIAADGTVRHYHAGFYQIRAEEGLRPLDNVLIRLIREARGKKK